MKKESENKLIGADLCKLSHLLYTNELCSDTTALEKAGQSCIGRDESSPWSYTLNKITFTASDFGRFPTDAEDVLVSLTVDIRGRKTASEDIENPLEHLTFDIEIEASRVYLVQEEIAVDSLYASWHLDKHISSPEDNQTKFSHPLYHFTFGGDKMESKGHDVYGKAIILNSPRLIHPPMDAVLGIDFILQNYVHKDQIKKLVQDGDYRRLVKKSQERLWKPFYTSLYSHWNPSICNTEENFTPIKLFPLYS